MPEQLYLEESAGELRNCKNRSWRAIGLALAVVGSLGMAGCDEGDEADEGAEAPPATEGTRTTD